ncbi:hypothetical protein COV58_04380 [Candidatus Roizmanbacteria bacterium CG11_big_fil_rev_8_21_14_0_20_36_8]|nr:MAG: hypothetical protein COV58_04380 [Candidatus Roizmanbacteria bacterium CG11_big_fil_rev_8_21_14_0_20_36_8]
MPQQNSQTLDIPKITQQIKDYFTKNVSGVIILPSKSTPDAIAAGTSLYLKLIEMGKNVSIISESIPQSDLLGADKIKNDLQNGGDNLVVSFPYIEGTIDKVDYNIQGERFNLVIVPRTGSQKIKADEVQFSYSGGNIDFIITIDAPNLNSLGSIYQKNERKFSSATIINIDRHLINNSYGLINFVSKSSSSTSELVLEVIKKLGTNIDKDIANNLYYGIITATNNLTSYSVTADTYEHIAELLRFGAVRKPAVTNVPNSFGQFSPPGNFGMMDQPYSPPVFNPQMIQSRQQPQRNYPEQQQFVRPAAITNTKSVEEVEVSPTSKEGQKIRGESSNELKPKIFSDSGGIMQ